MLGILFLIIRVLAAVALFAFLSWALWLIWNDLKRQTESAAVGSIPILKLTSLDDQNRAAFQASAIEMLVGRDPACDLLVGDQTVSGQHARLSYHLGQWWVEDLQSTNGTYLNQQAVTNPVVLVDKDQLRFGQRSFQVEIS